MAEQASNNIVQEITGQQEDGTCNGGCGFFGTEEREGYCSVCYKKELARREEVRYSYGVAVLVRQKQCVKFN